MKYLTLIALILLFLTHNTFAETLTLDSRYFQKDQQTFDQRGLPQFGYEVTSLRGLALEKATDSIPMFTGKVGHSILFFASEIIGGYFMDYSFNTAIHEQGHARAFAAFGLGYHFDSGARDFFTYYIDKLGQNGGYVESDKRH